VSARGVASDMRKSEWWHHLDFRDPDKIAVEFVVLQPTGDAGRPGSSRTRLNARLPLIERGRVHAAWATLVGLSRSCDRAARRSLMLDLRTRDVGLLSARVGRPHGQRRARNAASWSEVKGRPGCQAGSIACRLRHGASG
jgi:hypothetical protein